ncbi:MAG: phytoene desaturase [Candidatus Omnitrophica bacterium]|nr:phytoene desaturase [Candidatus Omnitrophota bacterium]
MRKKIAIVGAGVGGLATAARLASKGYQVEVFEKLSRCGGRAHIIEDRGFKFDTGPSFVLMPGFFKEVFDYCNQDINAYLNLKILDIHYKIFYPDGDVFTVYRDGQRTKEEIERFEPGGAKQYDKFIKETSLFYKAVEPLLYKCFRPWQLCHPVYWGLIPKLKIFNSYWDIAKKYFKSEKLCYALTFEAMFIGVSPFKTPAFYSIVTYADHIQKIFHPLGGMYKIPLALERMAEKFGARILYNSEVSRINTKKNKLLLSLDNGESAADYVVANADYAYAQNNLLLRRLPKFKYSCSVFLLYLGLKRKVEELEHHNLFFARDLRRNLKNIFDDKIISDDFSFYIHVPTRTDSSLAPEGKEILYVLIPVSNLEGFKQDFREYQDMLRGIVFKALKEKFGLNLEDLIEVEHRFYPEDFIKRYNIKFGATFGLAHTFMQSAFFRPPNIDQKIRGLYYVGASTQPGGGLPPVIASSRIVADLITRQDF